MALSFPRFGGDFRCESQLSGGAPSFEDAPSFWNAPCRDQGRQCIPLSSGAFLPKLANGVCAIAHRRTLLAARNFGPQPSADCCGVSRSAVDPIIQGPSTVDEG